VPTISGFEGQSAIGPRGRRRAGRRDGASRIAEYFVDMNQLDPRGEGRAASGASRPTSGRSWPGPRCRPPQGDERRDCAKSVDLLVRRIAGRPTGDLQWDQRVGLAIVLAQAHRVDLARPSACGTRASAEIDDEKSCVRSAPFSFIRFQVLRRALNLEIPRSEALRDEALDRTCCPLTCRGGWSRRTFKKITR
jgi:hypothetical protein